MGASSGDTCSLARNRGNCNAAAENLIAAQFHGGFFCPMEFSGDADRIDPLSSTP